jgi:hypothetical protein
MISIQRIPTYSYTLNPPDAEVPGSLVLSRLLGAVDALFERDAAGFRFKEFCLRYPNFDGTSSHPFA